MNQAVDRPQAGRQFAPWTLAAAALLLLLYAVTLDQGAVTQAGAYAHEFFHDARHMLGVPCH